MYPRPRRVHRAHWRVSAKIGGRRHETPRDLSLREELVSRGRFLPCVGWRPRARQDELRGENSRLTAVSSDNPHPRCRGAQDMLKAQIQIHLKRRILARAARVTDDVAHPLLRTSA